MPLRKAPYNEKQNCHWHASDRGPDFTNSTINLSLRNPASDKPLDECHGYFDENGNYRYVGNLKPPYTMAYFRGPADLEDRPRAQGVRPFLRPLRGAKITGFSGNLDEGYSLEYDVNGDKHIVNYVLTEKGVDFKFVEPDGTIREESHERRVGGGKGKG